MLLRLQASDNGFYTYSLIIYLFVDAWLITAGTNVGVVKAVGEALNNYRYKTHKHGLDVPCIGICTWEYTAGSEQLEDQPKESTMTNDNSTVGTVVPIKFRRRSWIGSTAVVRLTFH